MAAIVAVHSWRGGTGKSSVVTRLGFVLAGRGLRVGLVDTSLQTPGLHETVGVAAADLRHGLWDYLTGYCEIEDARHDATRPWDRAHGRLYLVPAHPRGDTQVIPAFGRYDPGLLHEGFHRLIAVLGLDVLLLDTQAGANYEAVYAVAVAGVHVVVTRAGPADARGARLAAALAGQVGRPRSALVVNMAPAVADVRTLAVRAERDSGLPVASVLPYAPDFHPLPGRAGAAEIALAEGFDRLADRVLALAGLPAGQRP